MGNANVVYTAWKPVDLSSSYYRSQDNNDLFIGNDNTSANAILTKDVIDKSLVFVYFKVNRLLFDGSIGEYKQQETIQPANANGFIKIPGRETSKYEDFMQYNVYHDYIGVNYLRFTLYGYTYTNGPNSTRVPTPEFANKNAQFFRDLLKDMPQYRIVIANGSTPGGRAAAVDFKDYAAVKRAYNLPD